jgi:SAM-dependent methyltransferase
MALSRSRYRRYAPIAADKPGGSKVTWVRADASATGLPDASFDAAVSNMGIIFVEPVAMVTELARLLKPGGALVFSTWVRGSDNPLFTPIVQVLGAPPPAVDEATRARLVEAFTTAQAAHESADGTVSFDTPYRVITARRR